MFPFLPAVRVYLATGATDRRKSINGLSILVAEQLNLDPLSGHLFAFCNRKRDIVKVLYWGVSRTQGQTCGAISKMGVGLPESVCRNRLQTP